MASKVALITGSNSGLGLTLSIMLAKEGWKVWAAMRDPANKGKDLLAEAEKQGVTGNVTTLEMDINDDESVKKAAETATADGGRLDLLVNNAGFATFGTLEMIPMEKIKAQFETNVFGVIRVTQALLPTMRAQRSGKLVYITSMGGVWGQCFNDVYCASKFAIEGMAESQCALFREFGVYVTCVEPGVIRTSFGKNAVTPDFSTVPADYQESLQKAFKFYAGEPGQTAEECAQPIMDEVVNVEKPKFRVQPNKMIKEIFDATLTDASGEAPVRLAATKMLGKSEAPEPEGIAEHIVAHTSITAEDAKTYAQLFVDAGCGSVSSLPKALDDFDKITDGIEKVIHRRELKKMLEGMKGTDAA